MGRFAEADISKVRTYSVAERRSLVNRESFAKPLVPGASLRDFLESLPRTLKARELLELASDIIEARERKAPVVWAMGAHVLKVGLSPLVIDLLERGHLTALAMNGAGAIHDLELGLFGQTSEDVDQALDEGSFGFAVETAEAFNEAARRGLEGKLGLGEALGAFLEEARAPYRELSVLHAASRLGAPATVHVALGTDIVHQHPGADGAALGDTSLRDFRILCEVTRALSGGVWLNVGSAVLLPEVFLKALSVARNLYGVVEGFVTANLDMIAHYRPAQNVLRRPTRRGGRSISLIGHHEILIPLLHAAIVEKSVESHPST